MGTVLRTLDAVGADGLFLLEGGADPYHPSVVRASMGTMFWKPFVQAPFDAFVQVLDGEGKVIIAGKSVRARTGEVVRMPANVPHAVKAAKRFKMLLMMLKAAR